MPEFIYQMRAVRKAHGDKVILDNVTLAFLPGAKIGVVGPNGTGKSTLLRMMAGVEQPSNGDARLLPGFTVGLLAQEPELDETKTVLGNVEDGVAEGVAVAAPEGVRALREAHPDVTIVAATKYVAVDELGALGYRAVLFPLTPFRAAMRAECGLQAVGEDARLQAVLAAVGHLDRLSRRAARTSRSASSCRPVIAASSAGWAPAARILSRAAAT